LIKHAVAQNMLQMASLNRVKYEEKHIRDLEKRFPWFESFDFR
jgi:hypothetical protein